ncbi:MarR family winged helix-turn-helix transcriptional regulator [Neisseria chenwenguii]|uniref:MarR family transcriptional regulator n=1 Tax=Neisseria chenwenguii TaxID=1853278 RepID=A0A220S1L4_9NEIS|nr:MarR family winged helix-turn-helix transcriptional regulator [Neisseria chenwenguii]ASK27364.1 MarR family transcriptional regulator [Neisseria chenwenguii]ROV56964.1 MarR family transcriptional regulator [Neisseria chenwenguii]
MPYLTYRLTQISNMAIKAADPVYQQAVGLKVRELRVLRLIHEMPHRTAGELLGMTELDKTLLSKNLAKLEQKGCIKRENDPNDSRRQYLDLTEQGEQIWQQAEKIGHELEQKMFAKLDAQEWEQLHQLLNQAWASVQEWQAGKI